MSANIDGKEQLIRLADVPKLKWLPTRNGKRLSLSTVHRWVQKGLGGQRLQTLKVGGAFCTTEQWVREFFLRLTPSDEGGAVQPVRMPATQWEQDLATVDEQLTAEGF